MHSDTKNRLTAARRGWVKKVKGLSKNKNLIDADNSMAFTRGSGGVGRGRKGKGRINSDGRRLDFGW